MKKIFKEINKKSLNIFLFFICNCKSFNSFIEANNYYKNYYNDENII